jgi:folylpolyglutamate synthase/dihydropteroate synthase
MTPPDQARLREVEREILARRPEHSIDPSLDRMSALVTLLGDPQRAYPVIHITGTNGKTSTARMTERLLRARGLRTGLFTSPHLSSIRERICVDGEPVSAERFVEMYEEIKPYLDLVDAREPVRLSFFEVLAGMAFATFADAPVDVAVIEVGMGGTWDTTNVADGAVAVITPVSIDHTRYLGDTVAEIAADKSGIIKPGAIAVIGQQPAAAAEVILRRAAEVGATVVREEHEFGVLRRELAVGGQQIVIRGLLGVYDGLFLPLFGAHQAGNLACALAATEAFASADPVGAPAAGDAESNGSEVNGTDLDLAGLTSGSPGGGGIAGAASDWGDVDAAALEKIRNARAELGRFRPVDPTDDGQSGPLDLGLVREAVATMSSPGRLEVVRRSPVVLVDAAHNPAGMAATVAALREAFSFSELIAIVAVSADKDITGILDQLEPVAARLVATRNSSDRSMDPDELADLAEPVFGLDRITEADRLDDAIEIATALADEADADGASGPDGLGGAVVLITGSVITAGEARLLLRPARAARGDAGDRDGEVP